MSGQREQVSIEVTKKLCNYALDLRFEDLDDKTIEDTKNIIIDVMGCIIGGSCVPDVIALADLAHEWGGAKEASIMVYDYQVPVHEAALVNCVMCRAFDFEPVAFIFEGKRYPPHIAGTTCPSAISLGEYGKMNGKDLLTSLVVANDITCRIVAATTHPWHISAEARMGLLAAEGRRPRGVGIGWGTVNALGVAASAARVFGLNSDQLRHAFGISLNMMAGPGGGIMEGCPDFKLGQGLSARAGIVAVRMAKRGWTGPKDPLALFYDAFSPFGLDHPENLTKDLGKKFYYETIFKPYPGGRPTHKPIEAALAIVKKHEFKAEDIEEVILLISSADKYGHYWKPFEIRDYPMCDALFSYKYATATALLRKRVTPENFMEEAIRDPRVKDLIRKIKLGDSPKEKGVELTVKLKDGREFYEYVGDAKGDPPNLMTREDLIDKFMMQVEFSKKISKENAKKLIDLILHIEDVDDIRKLVKLACA